MNIPNPYNSQISVCQKHNQPILFYDKNPSKGGFCGNCIQEKTGMIFVDSYKQQQKEIINNLAKYNQNEQQSLQNIYESILAYKNNLTMNLDAILKVILDKIESIEIFQQVLLLNMSAEENQSQSTRNLEFEFVNKQLENDLIKNHLKQLLLEFQKKYCNVDQLLVLLSQKSNTLIEQENFQYQLMGESNVQENNACYSFSFNKENSILIVGQNKLIIVYEFFYGKIIRELQRITEINFCANCLQFMKKSNSFLAADQSKIFIWESEANNNWLAKIQLIHDFPISSIIVNKNEDQVFSGCYKEVKFWIKDNINCWKCSQTIETKLSGNSLGLNQAENKLILCGQTEKLEPHISVLQQGNDKQWKIIQQIKTNIQAYRLCFTIGDQFVLQPRNSNYMEVYEYNEVKNQFEKFQSINVQQQDDHTIYFPCKYIEQLRRVVVKHGQNVNIFKINDDKSYHLMQAIEFKTNYLFGQLTDDGTYLVTWDQDSKQIQVRQFKQSR